MNPEASAPTLVDYAFYEGDGKRWLGLDTRPWGSAPDGDTNVTFVDLAHLIGWTYVSTTQSIELGLSTGRVLTMVAPRGAATTAELDDQLSQRILPKGEIE